VPPRHLRHDSAWRIGFVDHPSLVLVAPPAATPHANMHIDPAARRGRVKYTLDHICEPICERSCRRLAAGGCAGRSARTSLEWGARGNVRFHQRSPSERTQIGGGRWHRFGFRKGRFHKQMSGYVSWSRPLVCKFVNKHCYRT
jgi:hypothetical protein